MAILLAVVTVASILKIVLFLAVLSILVVLHEYGHFLLARLNNVRVLEFSVGMGPLIFGRRSKGSGTMYSLRAFPIGGYCAMHGEDNKTSQAEQQRDFRSTVTINGREYDDDNFQAKNPWRRLAIVLAGPVANFILTFVILLAGALAFGVQSQNVQPRVGFLSPGMPAQRVGLHAGDRIVSVDGVAVHGGDQLVALIHDSLRKPLRVTYVRDGAPNTVTVTPVNCPAPEQKMGCIGFSPVPAYERVPFGEAIRSSVEQFEFVGAQTFGSLALLASHPAKYGKQVSGVVGMGQAAMTIQDFGWGPYLFFASLISFALGVFNLLPLPALDGGRAAFIVGELDSRKTGRSGERSMGARHRLCRADRAHAGDQFLQRRANRRREGAVLNGVSALRAFRPLTRSSTLIRLRRQSKPVFLQNKTGKADAKGVWIGGDHPIAVQTMTTTDTADADATLEQIYGLAMEGAEIVRVTVKDPPDAAAMPAIVHRSPVPIVADIHFDHRMALAAIDAGVAKLRLNPGNIRDAAKTAQVVEAAKGKGIPIRIGVNMGSLAADLEKTLGHTAEAMVESAMRHVEILESLESHRHRHFAQSARRYDNGPCLSPDGSAAARAQHAVRPAPWDYRSRHAAGRYG